MSKVIHCRWCHLDIVRIGRVWQSKGLTPAARKECWQSPNGKHKP